ncbi:MAG TPA: sodium:solute symporter family protein [Vicinamibacterales bacterium]|nr:sodium:solute symporter family protein [Vicinamibacterales bacterium]
MSLHLVLLLGYSALLVGLGLWIGRRVAGTRDFFVAGRRLGPGLIFSTMLAANIGGGSTVGATGLGYRDGLSAWWWVGSAALGSAVLALWIGPRIRRVAAAHDLKTVGDFLELRYGRHVRASVSVLLWLGSLAIPAGQLIAIATILDVVTGMPRYLGSLVGGGVVIAYFTAGGLLTSAWVNMVQLAVKLAGFALALPLALHDVGGFGAIAAVQADNPSYWNPWHGGASGVMYLALLGPAFIVSPGLLQKIYGARDDRAVRLGVGLNAVGLLVYAAVPVLMGMIARSRFPDLPNNELALPMILMHGVPPVIGSLGLAAVFSAEISAADAGLFMLTTSLSQDLYKRFLNPAADDGNMLTVTRAAAIACGAIAVLIAIVAPTIIGVIGIFYALLGVSLFVPILAGLYSRRAGTAEAAAAIAAGVVTMVAVQFLTGGRGLAGASPALIGIGAASAGFAIVFLSRMRAYEPQQAV